MSSINNLIRGVIYEREKYTDEEIKEFNDDLIDYVNSLVNYCAYEAKGTVKEKLDLFAHCILSTIDGESGSMGGYLLIPIPSGHFYNPNFYLPDNLYDYDIAGALHDQFDQSLQQQ